MSKVRPLYRGYDLAVFPNNNLLHGEALCTLFSLRLEEVPQACRQLKNRFPQGTVFQRAAAPSREQRIMRITRAMQSLKDARFELEVAGCPKALDKVRKALSSTEGALRHARHDRWSEGYDG